MSWGLDDLIEYMLDLLREDEISAEHFADDLRSIGMGDPEIDEILAEEA